MKSSRNASAWQQALSLTAALTASLIVPQSVLAVDGDLTATGATINWNLGTNWSSTPTVPGGIGSTVGVTSNIGAARTVTINTTSATVGTLNIGDPTASFFAFTIAATGGASLIMDNGGLGAVINHTATGVADSISAPVRLDDNLTISNASASTFTIKTGTITATGSKTIENTGAGTGTVILSAPISTAIGIKQNSATSALTLSGVNTFTGAVDLTAGTLNLGSTTALGDATNTLTIAGGSSLDSTLANLVLANNNAQVWNGNFSFIGTQNLNLGTGAVSLGSTAGTTRSVTVDANTLTVGGIVSNGTHGVTPTTALTKEGAGTLVLNGANTYTGTTSLNAGVLQAGIIANNGVASGIGQGAAVPSAADLVFGGGTLRYNTATAATTDRLFTIGNASGSSATIQSSSANTVLGGLQFTSSGNVAFGTTGAHTLTLGGTHTGLGGAQPTRTTTNASTFAPTINDQAPGNLTNLVKTDAGVWVIAGDNGYTGGTAVNAGRLVSTSITSFGTGAVSVASGADVVLTVNDIYTNNFSIAGNGTGLAGNTSVGAVGGALVLNNGANLGGTLTLTADARISAVTAYADFTSQAGTVSGKITGVGQLEISSGGAATGGTIILANTTTTNDYTGGTRLSAGGTGASSSMYLNLGASEQIANGASTGDLTLNGLNYSGAATMRLNGFDETINGLNSIGWANIQNIVNNSATTASTLTVGDNDANGYYKGSLANGAAAELNLTKIGAGTQTLGRSATYTGTTRVEEGVLDIDFGGYAASNTSTPNNYLSASTDVELAGGTLRFTGRESGLTTSQSVTLSTANPRTILLDSVAGISVGQTVFLDDVDTGRVIQQIEGNRIYINGGITALTGDHQIGTAAVDFTHAQTLASLDLSASSTIEFAASSSTQLLTIQFGSVTQSVESSVLTITGWQGTADMFGGVNQLLFTGVTTDFTSVFDQNEVAFTGFGTGYSINQFVGYYEVAATVPEPTTGALLLLGATAFFLRRRRR